MLHEKKDWIYDAFYFKILGGDGRILTEHAVNYKLRYYAQLSA